ncbi:MULTISPECIES: DUF4895 domain-containing protein [unclassified Marinitoga]|uniref:DUF4895 domain-containing protein n=1 Tax=unclassified Marinitoga TaxID=2640159 RepID=UPI0006412747|nr:MULTISPECIES: DUF4895 domain-containing protein [unclassified Marinitoga]KLO20888.1 hypothetical protein X274_11615 [Marinitoga sp. 1155]NUU99223.1 hypothetical protein [Marinitoga sp. 1154]
MLLKCDLRGLTNLKKMAIKYFNEKKDKLADEYTHLVAFSIFDINNKFPSLNIFFDNEGKYFLSLMPEKPSKYMSSLYPKLIDDEIIDLKEIYNNLAKKYNKKIKISANMSIYQSPIIIPSFFVQGDEILIKKYILSEKLKGLKYLSLYKYIDDKTLENILKTYNVWQKDIYYYYTLNEVHFVFGIPDKFKNKSLVIEFGKLAKVYIKNKNPLFLESYKIPDMNIKEPVLMVLKTKIWNLKKINLIDVRNEIISKIDKSYDYIIKIFKTK